MIDKRLLAAIGGFVFVATWIGLGFGHALLCLLGAVVCWLAAAIVDGKVDLGELQRRLSGEEEVPAAPSTAPPRSAGRPRVQ